MEELRKNVVWVLARVELGTLSAQAFEQWVYNENALPSLVGADDSLLLLELNYQKKYAILDACALLKKHIEQRSIEQEKAKQLILTAGATLEAVYPVHEFSENDSTNQVRYCSETVIARFGGLSVKEDIAVGDVLFKRNKDADQLVNAWQKSVGQLHMIGCALRFHVILYIGKGAHLYFLADTTDQLFAGGPFWDGLATLLLGIDRFGPPIARDSKKQE